jgi:heat shock protein HslJ
VRGRSWALVALVLVTTGLSGCGHDTATQAVGEPQGPNAVPGSPTPTGEWLATSVTVGAKPKTLVAGTRISLAFADGQLRADGGCNTMSGPVRFADGVLIVDQLAQTEMGCLDGRGEQDQFVAGLLTARPVYSYDGARLELSTGVTDVVFGPKAQVQPPTPLEGTRWAVTQLTRGPSPTASADPNSTISARPAPLDAYLKFADGKLTGSDGCNSLFGAATITGNRITFGSIGTTKKACPGMSGTDELRAVLTGTVGWHIDDHTLTLTNVDGAGLQLQAPADTPVMTPPCCKPLVTGSPTPRTGNDLPTTENTAAPADVPPAPADAPSGY